MTYINPSSKLRLGHTISWNVRIAWNIYFQRSTRLNFFLNTMLKGLLRYMRIKLVKWFGNYEVLYFNLGILVHYWHKILHFKKRRSMKFVKWNRLFSRIRVALDSTHVFMYLKLPDYFHKVKRRPKKRMKWQTSGLLLHDPSRFLRFLFWENKHEFTKKKTTMRPPKKQSEKPLKRYRHNKWYFNYFTRKPGFINLNFKFR